MREGPFSNRSGLMDPPAVSPHGAWLASASFDGTVRLCDQVEGSERTFYSRSGHIDARWQSAGTAPGSPLAATMRLCGSGTTRGREFDTFLRPPQLGLELATVLLVVGAVAIVIAGYASARSGP